MKKYFSLLCVILIIFFCTNLSAAATLPQVSNEAKTEVDNSSQAVEICRDIGIIKGTGNGVTPEYISSQVTRLQAAIMFLRLNGLEEVAKSHQGTENFSDANTITTGGNRVNILSYLKENPELGFVGSGQNFYPDEKITAQEYTKVLLTALGYKIGPNGDCDWNGVLDLSASIGIIKDTTLHDLTVKNLAAYTVGALNASMKTSVKTLAASLVGLKVISVEAADKYNLFDQGNKRTGKILEFSGSVSVYQSEKGKTVAVKNGMEITEGDSISTGKNSRVIINIDDDKKVILNNNSKLEFTQLIENINYDAQQTYLTLVTGKIWIDISKKLNPGSKFLVKSSQTVMSVKGTQFFVGRDDGATDCAVLEGTVIASLYIPNNEPEEGSETQQSTIEVTLHQNEQITLDDTVTSDSELEIDQVTTDSLDLFVLETIRQDSEGIDPNLLNDIDQVIEQRQSEQAQETTGHRSNHQETNPNVVISGLHNIELDKGATQSINFTVSPTDAGVSVIGDISNDQAVISAFEITGSGGDYNLTVTSGDLPGAATLLVSAEKSGYESANQSIAINVLSEIQLPWPDSPLTFSGTIAPTAVISLDEAIPSDVVFDFEYVEDNGVFNDPLIVKNDSGYSLTVNLIAAGSADLKVIASKAGYSSKEYLIQFVIQ